MKVKRNFIVKILAASAFICEICAATQNFSAAKDAAKSLKEDEILILKSDLAAAKKQGGALQKLNLEERELAKNALKLPFEIYELRLSEDQNTLFGLGDDKGGIVLIDITEPRTLRLAGIFSFPQHEFDPAYIDIAQSKDGKSLFVADPNFGIYKLDLSDRRDIKISARLEARFVNKIELSSDGRTLFAKDFFSTLTAYDVKDDKFTQLAYFIAPSKITKQEYDYACAPHRLSEIKELGDLKLLSENELLLASWTGFYILDISDMDKYRANAAQSFNILKQIRYIAHPYLEIDKMALSKDGKRVFSSNWSEFGLYDLGENNTAQSNAYYSGAHLNNFKVIEDLNLAYLGKKISEKGEFPSVDLIDFSNKLDPAPIKRYLFPQSLKGVSVESRGKYLFFSYFTRNGAFISGLDRASLSSAEKSAQSAQMQNEILAEKSPEEKGAIWDLPYAKNGFRTVDNIIKSPQGYLLLASADDEYRVSLVALSERGAELWRKKLNMVSAANMPVAVMDSYVLLDNQILDAKTKKIIYEFTLKFKEVASFGDKFAAIDENDDLRFYEREKLLWKKKLNITKSKRPFDGTMTKIAKISESEILLIIEKDGFLKFNAKGEELWHKSVNFARTKDSGASDELVIDQKAQLLKAKDGSIFLLAKFGANIAKFDALGNEIWRKQICGRDRGVCDLPDTLNATYKLANYKEGLLLIGANDASEDQTIFLELNLDGNILRENKAKLQDFWLKRAVSTDDGGVLIGGGTHGDDTVIIKIRSDLPLDQQKIKNLNR